MGRRQPIAVIDSETCCPTVLTAELSETDAADLAKGFAALADPARLRVLNMLASAETGEVCVYDFVEPLGKSQPTRQSPLEGAYRRRSYPRWSPRQMGVVLVERQPGRSTTNSARSRRSAIQLRVPGGEGDRPWLTGCELGVDPLSPLLLPATPDAEEVSPGCRSRSVPRMAPGHPRAVLRDTLGLRLRASGGIPSDRRREWDLNPR